MAVALRCYCEESDHATTSATESDEDSPRKAAHQGEDGLKT